MIWGLTGVSSLIVGIKATNAIMIAAKLATLPSILVDWKKTLKLNIPNSHSGINIVAKLVTGYL